MAVKENMKTKQLTIRIPQSELDHLSRYAQSRQRNMSDVVRELIRGLWTGGIDTTLDNKQEQ